MHVDTGATHLETSVLICTAMERQSLLVSASSQPSLCTLITKKIVARDQYPWMLLDIETVALCCLCSLKCDREFSNSSFCHCLVVCLVFPTNIVVVPPVSLLVIAGHSPLWLTHIRKYAWVSFDSILWFRWWIEFLQVFCIWEIHIKKPLILDGRSRAMNAALQADHRKIHRNQTNHSEP